MVKKSQAQRDLDAALALRMVLESVPDPQKVLALDLSLNGPGFAVGYADGQQQTEHLRLDRVASINERLRLTASKVLHLALGGNVRADIIFVEQAFASTDNGSKTLMVHGGVRTMLDAGGWMGPIVEIHQSRVKSFALGGTDHTGEGKAPFVAVARERFGLQTYDPDEADALIILHFGWALLGRSRVAVPPVCMLTVDRMLTGRPTTAAQLRQAKAAA